MIPPIEGGIASYTNGGLVGFIERFLSKVDTSWECWVWRASLVRDGYGQFRIGRTMYFAHRASYELFNGPIPEGKTILHSCDNPRCIRPTHLSIGTYSDNINDAYRRGRMPPHYNLMKVSCPKGHRYTEENTYCYKGGRGCRECRREAWQRYEAKRQVKRLRSRENQ